MRNIGLLRWQRVIWIVTEPLLPPHDPTYLPPPRRFAPCQVAKCFVVHTPCWGCAQVSHVATGCETGVVTRASEGRHRSTTGLLSDLPHQQIWSESCQLSIFTKEALHRQGPITWGVTSVGRGLKPPAVSPRGCEASPTLAQAAPEIQDHF